MASFNSEKKLFLRALSIILGKVNLHVFSTWGASDEGCGGLEWLGRVYPASLQINTKNRTIQLVQQSNRKHKQLAIPNE